MLGSLDNEVIFKKAFTDKIVFEAFVKDILGLEITVGTIETEKKFAPPIGRIDFELDIFAETLDKRTVIELQRAQYDYNFDRFMHYLQMLVAEQQEKASKYKVKQTVYLIVIMTLPYKFNDLTGEAVKEEVIVTKFSSKNLNGKEIPIYGHQMVCLNPNHPETNTPPEIRDWLDLFYQSIHSPERPIINRNNVGIKRAAELIDFTKLTPQQLMEAKNKEQNAVVKSIYHEEGRIEGVKEGKIEGKIELSKTVALNALNKGLSDDLIAEITGLSVEEIREIRAKNKT
jgi:predicted transposase/invertase (TIGR01784 family)